MTPRNQTGQNESSVQTTHSAFDVTLPDAAREACFMSFLSFSGMGREVTPRSLRREAHKSAVHLAAIEPALRTLQMPGGHGYGVIRNLPTDPQVPPPPTDGKRPDNKQTWVSELVLYAVLFMAGLKPMAYQQLRQGALIHEIAPTTAKAESASSLGRVDFGFHTDMAIFSRSFRPDVLVLTCVTNPGKTPTLIAPLDAVLAWLRAEAPEVIAVLMEPRFRYPNPVALNLGNGKLVYSKPRPLLTCTLDQGWEIAGNFPAIEALDSAAQNALAILQIAFEHATQSIVLEPGMMLIFNNHQCVHGRGAFSGQRWLQRLYGRWSLEALQCATGQHQSEPVFDARLLLG